MFTIQKVLNSSVVLVHDEQGKETILLAKGVGYGKKAGEQLELNTDGKVFIPLDNSDASKLKEILDNIPAVYLEITQEIVSYAKEKYDITLNHHIYLALTDHLHFAVQRMENEMIIVNRVFWEIKNFYPKEFKIGLFAIDLIKKRLNVELPEEEAANVAFHIVNAQKAVESQYDAMRAAKLIGAIVTMVTYIMQCQVDKDSIHYSRFISHLQYFSERFFTGKMLEDNEDFMYKRMEEGYPLAISCAEKIRTFLYKTYDKVIPNEEVAYLAVHIQRLSTRES